MAVPAEMERMQEHQWLNASALCNDSDHGNGTDPGPNNVLFLVNIYYGIIYILGMCGNSLVLYVVCRYSKMHTVTNFFILSLALADLSFLLNMPFLMVTQFKERWIFGHLYCRIFFSMTTVNQFASSFLLMVMSADRYFAVCHPIQSNRYRTAKAAIVVCSVIWITSVTLMIPVFIYSGLSPHPEANGACSINWPGSDFIDGMQAFTLYCFVLGFAFPLLLIVAFYSMVLRKVRTLGPRNSQGQSDNKKRNHRRVTMMVFAVISAYVTCWLPYWTFQVLLVYTNLGTHMTMSHNPCEPEDFDSRSIIINLVSILQALCYTNSCVNPILYAMLSENFKKSFLAACCGRRHHLEMDFHVSTAPPEQSVFARSKNSIRRRFLHRDEDDDESPIATNGDDRMEIASYLQPLNSKPVKNGTNRLAIPSSHRNGSTSGEFTSPATGNTMVDKEEAV